MDTPRLLHTERIVSAARSVDLGRGAAMCATIALTAAAIGSGLYLQDRAVTSGSDASRTTLADWSDPRLPRPRPLADEPLTTGSINPLDVAPVRSLQDEIALAAAKAAETDTRDRLRDKAVLIARHASINSFSVKGSPTCTVGRFSSDLSSNSADAIVAPWMPSRPVFEPTYTTGSPTPFAAE